MRRYSIYIVVAVLVVLGIGAGFFFLHQSSAPVVKGSSEGAFASAEASSTPAASITSSSVTQPPNSKEYESAEYGFSLYYPDDLTAVEHPQPSNSIVVTFQDKSQNEGFQIFVTPDNDPKITQQRFEMDEPSGVMNDPQNITIDGVAATEFFSTNSAMGASREIWFLHGGYLYEVTTPQPLDSWLLSIMQTWQFI